MIVDARMLHASGIGTYIANLMPRVAKASHNLDMDFICRSQDANWVDGNSIINNSDIYSIAEQFTLISPQTIKADLFWSPHYNIPVLSPTKQLVTVHDVFHLAMPEFLGGIHKKLYAKMMFAAVRHKASHVICVSEFSRAELIRLTGINPDKITVIYNGIAEEWFNVPKLHRLYAKPYLLYVGNVKPHKNLRRLLQAFEALIDTIPHDLVIVGNKEGFITGDQEVMQSAAALGDRVFFTGYVDDQSLKQYYAHADCFVFPSLYEGFGFPPLEAMACGCPTIVADAASLPEVCGDATLYCDTYDVGDIRLKIKTLLESQALREDLIIKGIERAGRFTWDSAADQTLSVIDRLING